MNSVSHSFPNNIDCTLAHLWQASVESWIELEKVQFKWSGFHPSNEPVDAYEGRPTAEKEALWAALSDS